MRGRVIGIRTASRLAIHAGICVRELLLGAVAWAKRRLCAVDSEAQAVVFARVQALPPQLLIC